jgi:membrane protease YdiL (CAAX protease family)
MKGACVKAISATQPVSRKQRQLAEPPLGLIGSFVYFGIPAALFAGGSLRLIPWMFRRGFSGLTILNVVFGGLATLLLVAALVAFRLEGYPSTWTAFRDRMRLSRPTRTVWLWTLAALIVAFGVTMLVAPFAEAYLGLPLVTLPAETLAFMNSMNAGFPEIELSGRWGVFLWLVFALAVLNIGGEELWWRGIILPRQEVVFGRWAWAVNGTLWNLFHIGRYATLSDFVIFIPATLAISYVAQRTRNTWPGIVVHLILNTFGTLAVFNRIVG